MILADQLSLFRNGKALFQQASFAIHPGWRVGLAGANGAGKSSLFAMLLGQLQADHGRLERPSQWVVAHMAQEVAALDRSALDYVLDGDHEWRLLDDQITHPDDLTDNELANAYARYEAIDGYSARARAAQLLAGLGFAESDMTRDVAEFSGGWRMRLNLGRALMCRSDLLLLDEPTNHLDLDAILWLEDWLRSYPGTLFLISHDRDFLDAVIEHVLHVAQGTITPYRGNYSTFERTRAERYAQQQQAFEKQQAQVAHLQSYIDRFRAQATKAKQAQSRIKALERMTLSAPAEIESGLTISFREPDKLASPLLRLDEAVIGYDQPLLNHVQLALYPGTRIALLGPNGAGKSTLVKALVGDLPLLSGVRQLSEHTRIGYFAQHQVDHLDMRSTPLQIIQRMSPKVDELTLRTFLGGFGFFGDKVNEVIEPFSGGEKARLGLALIVWQRPNVLLLDEPTNHLDLALRHALMVAIAQFTGAVVLVSHDRHMVSACCDELLLVHSGRVERFDGDVDDYASWLRKWRAQQARPVVAPAPVAPAPAPVSAAAPAPTKSIRSATLRSYEQAIAKAERALEVASEHVTAIAEQLNQPAIYESDRAADLARLLQEQKQAQAELEQAELTWVTATEALDQLLNG